MRIANGTAAVRMHPRGLADDPRQHRWRIRVAWLTSGVPRLSCLTQKQTQSEVERGCTEGGQRHSGAAHSMASDATHVSGPMLR